jgi:hypothetical protein
MTRGLGWIMFFVLLTLKLGTHHGDPILDISWWWVTAPLWIPLIILGLAAFFTREKP